MFTSDNIYIYIYIYILQFICYSDFCNLDFCERLEVLNYSEH